MYFPTPWLVLTNWILEDSMLWSWNMLTVRLVASHCCVSVWSCFKYILMLIQRKCEIVEMWTNSHTLAKSNWTQQNPAPLYKPADCDWEIKSLSLRWFQYIIIVKRINWWRTNCPFLLCPFPKLWKTWGPGQGRSFTSISLIKILEVYCL